MCSHGKVAIAGVTMTERFGLGPADVCYVSMPLFHSNAVLVGLGGGAGLPRLNGVAAQVLRVAASCPTSAATARPTPTTSASRCRMCSPHPSARTTPTIRCGRCTATRAHPPTSTGSPPGSAAGSSTGSGRPRAGSPSAAPRTPRTARWARCPTGSRSSTSTPASRARSVWSASWSTSAAQGVSRATTTTPRPTPQRMAGGVYHSGDLAYRDEDGYAYFAGRLGDWMRVDGENLGTAPIERVLLRHPDVTEVAVYAVPDPAVGDQVMAALVLASGAEFDAGRVPRVPRRAARSRPQAVAVLRAGQHRACRAPRRSRCSSGNCRPRVWTARIPVLPIRR